MNIYFMPFHFKHKLYSVFFVMHTYYVRCKQCTVLIYIYIYTYINAWRVKLHCCFILFVFFAVPLFSLLTVVARKP